MSGDLLSGLAPSREHLAEGAMLLRGFAAPRAAALLEHVRRIAEAAPFRRMETPGGHRMSVAMTNCGGLGWVTDRRGYRYDRLDPLSGRPWPEMPEAFATLAAEAAEAAGFTGFAPDACLINRYEPGARMGLHQDRDEHDQEAPIVSVSLGLPAVFLFGGLARRDPARRLRLESGDVAAWGGASRMAFHGIAPLAEGEHPLTGRCRINLTFRKAGQAS
ncbi:MAG TPA: DNA oxidative demethylase AlkB [Acetobacteraceae bacterium]|nr:DNA oxidative demethylase AlkB [Acetobacteraceae bacterium]